MVGSGGGDRLALAGGASAGVVEDVLVLGIGGGAGNG